MTTTMTALEKLDTFHSVVAEALGPYEAIEVWPGGKSLFREGSHPDGVWLIHEGEVELSFSSPRSGDSRPLLLAGTGEILGLSAVVSGRNHDCSATTRGSCVTGFIETNQFLRLLDEKPTLWLTVLRMLSSNINSCWECMRGLAMGR